MKNNFATWVMKKRNYIGSKAIDILIFIVSVLMYLSIGVGAVLMFVALTSYKPLFAFALILICSFVPLLVLKAILRGFESMVIASEMYIEQMEIEKDVKRKKCAESVQEEL